MLLLLLAGISCAALMETREDYKPLKQCQDHVIDFTQRCAGRILSDGVVNCNMCFKKTSRIFPKDEDMVGGCYDYERNAYCVSIEYGCNDGACRDSPVPAFGKQRPDMRPSTQQDAEPKDGSQ